MATKTKTTTRTLAKPVAVTLPGGDALELRLDMTALLDFEEASGLTVPAFVAEIVEAVKAAKLTDEEQAVFDAVRATGSAAEVEGANETGLALMQRLLGCPSLSARNVLTLVWAMAGGEDLGATPREFGRRVALVGLPGLLVAVMEAVSSGMPSEDEEEADGEAEGAGADPT